MSTANKNRKNKDQGLWSLVLSALVLSIAFHSPKSHTQGAANTKPKTNIVAPEATEADDNVADTEDAEDDQTKAQSAQTADDNVEEAAEPLTAGEQPAAIVDPNPEQQMDITEDNTEPAFEQPPAEALPEAPAAESMQTPEPYIPSEVTETAQLESPSDAEMVEVISREETVEVELRKNYLPYRERRTRHGFLFSFNAENLYFQDYASIVDQKLYEELFGQEDLTLLQVQFDYKLNFMLGSLIAGAGFGYGTLIDDRVGEERSLTISKKSLRAQWLLDSIMNESYFVPYAGVSYWQFGITEENTTLNTTSNYDTGNGTALTVGFLLQLNWLEPDVAKGAYLGQGLENTYLDVFWSQYQNTDNELDPVFENDFNFGVGLRMEF